MMLKIAAIGLGNRTCKYLKYVKDNPEHFRLDAIVEPDLIRRENVRVEFGLSREHCFESVEQFWNAGLSIDAVFIGTPDKTHFEISMGCLKRNWHLLLEKPAASSSLEYEALIEESARRGLVICVCYVLRYHPYYSRLKKVLEDAALGRLISVSHTINIGYDRMVHSFVRGLWSRSEESSPIIVSKASHDIDLLYWLIGSRLKVTSSEGGLEMYRSENAPEGSADRCVGCRQEKECPFSAIDLYLRRDDWNNNFNLLEGESKEDAVMRELREGRYGRCVYRCDNDVVDSQIVEMVAENGCKVTLVVDGRIDDDSRVTCFEYDGAEVYADGKVIRITRGGEEEVIDLTSFYGLPLHSGADMEIVKDFYQAIVEGTALKGTDIITSKHSHDLCMDAELLRLSVR